MTFHTLTWHYTATYDDQDIGREEIEQMHLARGFAMIGYHGGARLDGTWEWGRPLTRMGAHVGGHNRGNLGFYTVGGLQRATGNNVGVDTRTQAQREMQVQMTRWALEKYPSIERVLGHKDQKPTQCPGYDVSEWWAGVQREGEDYVPPQRPSAGPAVTRPLTRRGNRGQEVEALQAALKRRTGDPTTVDGIFGPATERAVRAFQSDKGLAVDGMVGPSTWAALLQQHGRNTT